MRQHDHLYRSHLSIIGAALNGLDARDGIAEGHSKRVANYACAIRKAMALSPESQRTLELAALLRDVGKILISEQIRLDIFMQNARENSLNSSDLPEPLLSS